MPDTPKDIYVEIVDRDFSTSTNPPNLAFTVNRYSKTIDGGCKEAYITAFGNENQLWELANMLRFGINIYDKVGTPLWWGYIAEVKIRVGNLVFGVSLDTMFNKVAVIYTNFGVREKTAFSEDEHSTSIYGIKELLSVVSDATNEQALQRRDSDLDAKKLPIPTTEFEAQSEGSFSANIIAKGYYETLGWRYYSQDKGLEQHSINGVGQQNLGIRLTGACLVFTEETNTISHWNEGLSSFKKGERISVTGTSSNNGVYTVSQGTSSGSSIKTEESLTNETAATTTITSGCHIAQRFIQTSGSNWDISSIHIRIQPSGSPTDDAIVYLWSHYGTAPNGSPQSELASGSIAASAMSESMVWTEIPLSSSVTLVNGTSYYVIASRTGSPSSASQYYKVDMDEGLGYENGEFRINTSNGWMTRTTDADMLFKAVGTQPVVDQIEEIGNTVGEFFTGVVSSISSACSTETNQYRDGESTALSEINELIKIGTKDNYRIITEVTPGRKLMLTEQPSPRLTTTEYLISVDGNIRTSVGERIPKNQCPVGIWVKIDDFIPATFDLTYLSNPGKFFIEESEYYVQSDRLVPRSINTSNVWELGKIKDG